MTASKRDTVTGDIDVATSDRFETCWHRLEIACWLAMLLIVLAALAGLTGNCPLSHARSSAPGALVEHDRIALYRSSTLLVVWLRQQGVGAQVGLSESLLENVNVVRVTPPPLSAGAVTGIRYRFAAGAGARLQFEIEPRRPGIIAGSISVNADVVPVRMLILP